MSSDPAPVINLTVNIINPPRWRRRPLVQDTFEPYIRAQRLAEAQEAARAKAKA